MSEGSRYVFTGRVIPERSNVHIQSLEAHSEYGKLDISIASSQIQAVLDSEDGIENIHTARNSVKSAVHEILDIFSFTHGYSYSIEITSVTYPNNRHRVFGVDVGILQNQLEDDERSEMFQTVLQVIPTEDGRYLKRCLKNLRLSTNNPVDTGLHCYRAIEAIRKYFHSEFDIPDDEGHRSEAWKTLRDELDVSRSNIEEVKEYADEPRHGGIVEITDEERADVFETTWNIICAFVEYLHEKEDLDPIRVEMPDSNSA
ncbi:hypothetical protein ABSL23_03540 [Halobacterium sp. NMX12-1]|uniref:DUF4145 domain-containing protein n=1 Tax=Halobacterium sp. NMX12-1 TaxID=3166650 RepID=A0AAU8CDJ0_9EURY